MISNKNLRERATSVFLGFIKIVMHKNLKNILRFVLIAIVFGVVSFSSFVLPANFTQAQTISTVSTTLPVFTRTLRLQTVGADVKALQIYLNTHGYTIATTGPGSLGNETTKFGLLTYRAVIRFQKANNLFADGIFGPKSRAVLTGGSVQPSQVSQSGVFPAGCTSTTVFSATSGVPCGTMPLVSLPAGCTTTTLFSRISGLSCTTGQPAAQTTPVVKRSGGSSGSSIQTLSSTISGVTIPAQGATPISTLADTTQYTATISWTGSPAVFAASTSYTATITLTPKSGYTLEGVTANYFTVAGANSTNSVSSGVVSAVFPATPLIQLTISSPIITTSKTYNGTTSAIVSAGTLAGIIGSETVTVSAVATYDTKNIGTSKNITVVYTLGGADAGNYIKPADYTVATGEITSVQLTIANPTLTTSKEYDRTTTAVVVAGALSGVAGGDVVTVSAVATYDTLNIGTSKNITVVYTLGGADAGNYIKPVDRIVTTGVITTKQLTIADPALTLSKSYDGNTSAVVTAGSLVGVAGSEDVSVSAVGTYNNASVATGKTITVVYTLSGAETANYIKPINYTTSSGVITLAPGPSAPSAPTVASKTDTSVTLTANALHQFSSNGTTWQDSNIFNGLTSSTSYTFYARVKATATTDASVASTGTVGTTLVVTPTFSPVAGAVDFGTTVTITAAGADAIYYTTNGVDPTISDTNQAITPLVINSVVTVKALAVKAGFDNSAIGSAAYTQTVATAPSSVVLAVGSTAPVGAVVNVAIPAAGATDTTGAVTGYVATSADNIKFTVVDGGSAVSTITINGGAYTSGADYQIVPTTSSLSIVVTTTETNKASAVRTFTIAGPIVGPDTLTYGVVIGADGKKWLDKNLGAAQVATSATDHLAYGSLFQWGRLADGHELRTCTNGTSCTSTNGSTATLATTDTPGDALFITNATGTLDWRTPQNNSLWQGVSGTNNSCPTGYRLPTNAEWGTLISSAGITNSATAFSSTLKLTMAGSRDYSNALLLNLGTYGIYWSSGVSGTLAQYMYFNTSSVTPSGAGYRASGLSVRCLKD